MKLHARTFSALAAVSEIGDDNRQWIEVLPTADKVRNGPFYFSITADDLAVYARSIQDNPGRIPIDYDHEGAVGGSTRAAGWFTGRARVDDDAERGSILAAEVEWTPKAAQEIRDGEFKFISGEPTFEKKDQKTGLMSKALAIAAATLTNRPFFEELSALAAALEVVWRPEMGVQQIQSKLCAALNHTPDTDDGNDPWSYWVVDVDVPSGKALVSDSDDGSTYVVPFTVADNGDVTVGAQSGWVKAEQEWVAAAAQAADSNAALLGRRPNGGSSATTEGDHMSEELKALATELGLEVADDATAEQITGQITEATKSAQEKAGLADALTDEVTTLREQLEKAAPKTESEVELLRHANEQLAERVKGLEAAAEEREKLAAAARKDSAIAKALEDGQIRPDEHDLYRGNLDINEEATLRILASLPKGRVPVAERGGAPAEAKATQEDGWFPGREIRRPTTTNPEA